MAKKKDLVERHLAILKDLQNANKKAEAGWFESARYKAGLKGNGKPIPDKLVGTPIARIARIQEFGATIKRGKTTIVIPARPFMRYAGQLFEKKRTAIQAVIADQLFAGTITVDQAMKQMAMFLEGCIVESIDDKGQWAKNADSTIEKKGFDRPLIDSSQMWQTVSSKVSDNSSET